MPKTRDIVSRRDIAQLVLIAGCLIGLSQIRSLGLYFNYALVAFLVVAPVALAALLLIAHIKHRRVDGSDSPQDESAAS
jgi:hypothetical protein